MTDAVATVLGIVVVAVVAGFALLPLLRDAPVAPAIEPAPGDRFGVYRQVLELEFDAQTGKLSRADLEVQRAELLAKATDLLRQERTSAELEIEAEVEREIAAARRAFAEVRGSRRAERVPS